MEPKEIFTKKEKDRIRKKILKQRESMTEEMCHQASDEILRQVLSLAAFQAATSILLFASFRKEVETKGIFRAARQCGMTIGFPRIEPNLRGERGMRFYQVDREEQMQNGFFGIAEPVSSCPAMDGADLMVMPGVVFDLQCHRIGFGGGFYDRYLASHSIRTVVAVAYDFQVIDAIPYEPTDMSPDLIITESRILRRRGG